MTSIVFLRNSNNQIISVECSGHTGYGIEGEDIVCAGISCLVQTAILGLLHEAKVNIDYTVDEKKAYVKVLVPENITREKRHDADIILNTLLIGLSDMYEGFSDFMELEVL